MSKISQSPSEFFDALLSAGTKVCENAEQIANIGLSSTKQLMNGQFELVAAVADLGTAQYESVAQLGDPREFLQSQKDAYEAFGGKLQTYFEGVRGSAQDAQQAYVKAGEKVAADLTAKAA